MPGIAQPWFNSSVAPVASRGFVSGGAAPPSVLNLDFTSGLIPAGVTGLGGANATVFNNAQQITPAVAPRIDYGNTLAATYPRRNGNFTLQSNIFSNAAWAKQGVGTGAAPVVTQANNRPDPFGGNNASTVVFTPLIGANSSSKMVNLIFVPTNKRCDQQIWIKGALGVEELFIAVQTGASPFNCIAVKRILPTTAWQQFDVTFIAAYSPCYMCIGLDNNGTGSGYGPILQAGGTVDLYNDQTHQGDYRVPDITTTATQSAFAANIGLVVEPATTNLVNKANDFTLPEWVPTVTSGRTIVATAGFPGPDGSPTSATRVVMSGTTGGSQNCCLQQLKIGGYTPGIASEISIWVAGTTGNEDLYLGIQDGTTPFGFLAATRINKPSVGVFECYTAYFTPTTANIYISIGSNTTTNAQQNQAVGGTVYIYNCQGDDKPIPTSTIVPGNLTRTADAVSFTIPAGLDTLTYTFDDGTMQDVGVTPGVYTIPTDLNRQKIATIVGSKRVQKTITSFSYGTPYRYNFNWPTRFGNGDTFAPTWANDDNHYSFSDDFFGWQGVGLSPSANMAFSKFSNPTPSLFATMVNAMAAFGIANELGADGASYKLCGLTAIDGKLIAAAARQVYGNTTPFIQSSIAANFIVSTDKGVTWTPQPPATAQPYAVPMFSGSIGQATFCSPFPIQYGRGQNNPGIDNADLYSYWLSVNNVWNNGSNIILGRCLKSLIFNLNTANWEFFIGGDGMLNAAWSSNVANAVAVMTDAGQLGMGGAQYLGDSGCYGFMGWFYPSINQGTPVKDTAHTTWTTWIGTKPWLWTKVQTTAPSPGDLGLYNPIIIPGSAYKDNGKTFTLVSAGDFGNANAQTGYYTLTFVDVTVNY